VAITASSSVPFAFPSQHLRNVTYNDGGAIYNTNLISAVDKCIERGYTQEQVVLDIIICTHRDPI